MPGEVIVYSRARCGVCRRAEAAIARELRRTWPSRRPTLRIVDVDEAGLDARYGVRVPVVTLDGIEISELEWTAGTLRQALRERRARRADRQPRQQPPQGPGTST
jgi:glutaredoxin